MYLLDIFDPADAPIAINPPTGNYDDPDARIWPFKIHRGKQAYDTQYNRILPIYTVGKKGSGALWSDYDWQKALEKDAQNNKVEFSGKFDFIRTDMYWPIKHMVAPKEDAVKCDECHAKNGRLAALNDFYLIGRDANPLIEGFGLLAIFGGLAGVIAHGGLRYWMTRRRHHKTQDKGN